MFMTRFSIIVSILFAASFFSFKGADRSVTNDLVGIWSSRNVKDPVLRNLTFQFSESTFKILSDKEQVATGTFSAVKEEVLVSSEPFVYEEQEVLYLSVDETTDNSFPKLIKVKERTKARMLICYERGKSHRYVTLHKE
jgi:hypothetical protein